MTTKHTPGPWSHHWSGSHRETIVVPKGHGIVAVVGTRETDEETQTNAVLIAAAPELLEALKDIASVDSPEANPRFYDLNGGERGVIEKMVNSALAAIATITKTEKGE